MATVLNFDGVDQYTLLDTPWTPTSDFELNLTAVVFDDGADAFFFTMTNNGNDQPVAGFGVKTAQIRVFDRDNAGSATDIQVPSVTLGIEHEYTIRFTGGVLTFLVDNVLVHTSTTAMTNKTVTLNTIGCLNRTSLAQYGRLHASTLEIIDNSTQVHYLDADSADTSNTGLQPVWPDVVATNNAVGENFPTNGDAWIVTTPKPNTFETALSANVSDIVGNITEWTFANTNSLAALPLGSPTFNGSDTVSLIRANNDGFKLRDNLPTLQTAQTYVPDGAQAQNPSGGFTCTGLFKMQAGTWLVGNHGVAVEGSGVPNTPSLVVLSSDFTTIVNEFDMTPIAGANSVQGVVEANDGTFYFACPQTQTIYHVSSLGVSIDSISTVGNVNGLTYDSVNNNLWYFQSDSRALEYDLDLDVLTGKHVGVPLETDQIYFDPTTKLLYATHGNNSVNGNVAVTDTEIGYIIAEFPSLFECQAIEGIHVENNTFYIANDGGFHTAANPARNIIFEYAVDLDQMYAQRARNIEINWEGTLTGAAPASKEVLLQQNDPEGSLGGWALYATSTDRLRFEVKSRFDTSTYFVEYSITRGVTFTLDFTVDTNSNTVEALIDSIPVVPVATSGLPADFTGYFNSGYIDLGINRVGTQYPASFNLNAISVDNQPAVSLVPDNTFQDKSAEVVTISQLQTVVPNSTSQDKTATVVTLQQTNPITPADTSQSKTAEAVVLSMDGVVSPTNTSQSKTAEVVNLSQTYLLTPDNTYQDKTAEVVLLSVDGAITALNTYQSKAADVVTILTDGPVVPAYTYSDTTAEQVFLGTIRAGYLTAQVSIKDAITTNVTIN